MVPEGKKMAASMPAILVSLGEGGSVDRDEEEDEAWIHNTSYITYVTNI
jgi:hypothetical protein